MAGLGDPFPFDSGAVFGFVFFAPVAVVIGCLPDSLSPIPELCVVACVISCLDDVVFSFVSGLDGVTFSLG